MRRLGFLLAIAWLAGCGKEEIPVAPCAALVQGCTVALGAQKILAQTETLPVPLKPFTLTVSAPAAHAVSVAFQMQGMAMGLNRYRLLRGSNGVWYARITLPVCVSGRRDWLMILEVDGVRRALPFQTPGN